MIFSNSKESVKIISNNNINYVVNTNINFFNNKTNNTEIIYTKYKDCIQ